jgi:hypothetical protein
MEHNAERIDDLFRERLTNYEQKPDDQVWKRIADRLRPGRQRNLTYFIIRIAAGMTLLFSLGLGYFLLNRQGEASLPSVISLQSTDKLAKDTLSHQKTKKSQPNQPERKKSEKSDRLQPVRKVYKGPEIITLNAGNEKSGDLSGIEMSRKGDLEHPAQEPAIYSLTGGRQLSLLPSQLPLQLDYAEPARQSVPVPESGLLPSEMENFSSEDQEKKNHHEWLLGGEVAPLYSYRTISSDYLNSSIMNSMNKSENGLLAYAGGIRIAYGAGKRLSVQSGLYYSRYGQEKSGVEAYTANLNEALGDRSTTYISILNSTGNIDAGLNDKSQDTKVVSNSTGSPANFYFGTGFPGINSGNVTPTNEGDLSATQYFDYLELPLTVKYKIIDRKFGFSLLGGLVTNFLMNNGIDLYKNGSTHSIGKTSDINKVNYLGSVGLGFEYPVVRNVAFSIEPRFRYYLNPIDQSSQISVHPYSFGIFAGISYGF